MLERSMHEATNKILDEHLAANPRNQKTIDALVKGSRGEHINTFTNLCPLFSQDH